MSHIFNKKQHLKTQKNIENQPFEPYRYKIPSRFVANNVGG
jgi:hypothetical protein